MKYFFKPVNVFLFVLLTFFLSGCSDIDDLTSEITSSKDIIEKSSPLFELITNVVTPNSNPLETVVCLDFVYPFEILIYDVNKNIIGQRTMIGDVGFSAFLSNIPSNQAISISYPLKTTLANGNVFVINSNAELKLAIDSCSREDIISYCNGLFGGSTKCIWTVPYTTQGNNKYASGYFDANTNNTISFFYNGNRYDGTWTFVFINDELNLNISLAGTSAVAQFWSISKKIEIGENSITLLTEPKNIILKQTCEDSTSYIVGQNRTDGGIIFYDKGFYSSGWRYMEASLQDLAAFEWGCANTLIADANQTAIGKGLYNSVLITNFHDDFQNYYTNPAICNQANNGTIAAQKSLTSTILNKKDWFLPSEMELHQMYINLKLNGLGNFTNDNYWSSTQIDATQARTISFLDGTNAVQNKIPVATTPKCRVIRYF